MWQLSAISAKNTLAGRGKGRNSGWDGTQHLIIINMFLILIVQSKYYTLHSNNII